MLERKIGIAVGKPSVSKIKRVRLGALQEEIQYTGDFLLDGISLKKKQKKRPPYVL